MFLDVVMSVFQFCFCFLYFSKYIGKNLFIHNKSKQFLKCMSWRFPECKQCLICNPEPLNVFHIFTDQLALHFSFICFTALFSNPNFHCSLIIFQNLFHCSKCASALQLLKSIMEDPLLQASHPWLFFTQRQYNESYSHYANYYSKCILIFLLSVVLKPNTI